MDNKELDELMKDEEGCKRLLKAILSDNGEVEAMEMTNLFKVTDKSKFYEIAEHIQNENGVGIIDKGERVGLYANDTLCICTPLEIDTKLVKEYEGDSLNTLKLLQGILPDEEFIVLQGTSYTVGKDDIQSSVLKVTNREIKTIK